MNRKTGFVGLGSMGLPIARNLLAAGFPVSAYNRTAEWAAPLVAEGAELAASLAAVVDPDGVVITMLADDAAVREVVTGKDGLGGPARIGWRGPRGLPGRRERKYRGTSMADVCMMRRKVNRVAQSGPRHSLFVVDLKLPRIPH